LSSTLLLCRYCDPFAYTGTIRECSHVATLPGLNRGQKRALIAKLKNALRSLDQGKKRPAINQLKAFVNNVEALIRSGRLSPDDGQQLINDANAIIEIIVV